MITQQYLSNMKCLNKNTPTTFFYKTENNQSGSTIVFNIWNDTGTQLVTDEIADGEISTQGVYEFDFTTPNSDVYLLVTGAVQGGIEPRPLTVKVGTPVIEKVFFAEKNLEASLTIPYNIFNFSGTSLQSGNLTNITNGFYSADVTSLAKPWVFEAEDIRLPDEPCS